MFVNKPNPITVPIMGQPGFAIGNAFYKWFDKRAQEKADAMYDYGNLEYQRQLELMSAQQAFNASEAQKNRDFQLELANSAYQRAAQDLKKAGFNPALMLGSSGAATPSGSMASIGSYSAPSTTSASATRYAAWRSSKTATTNTIINSATSVFNQILKSATDIASSFIQRN